MGLNRTCIDKRVVSSHFELHEVEEFDALVAWKEIGFSSAIFILALIYVVRDYSIASK